MDVAVKHEAGFECLKNLVIWIIAAITSATASVVISFMLGVTGIIYGIYQIKYIRMKIKSAEGIAIDNKKK